MKWIVLSDLHMNFKNCTTDTARNKLIEALEKERNRGKISFVLIAGDFFYQNKGDVDELLKYIKRIEHACGIQNNQLILCPGNHDIDRLDLARNNLIEQYRENEKMPSMKSCLTGYTEFERLYMSVFPGQRYTPFSIKTIGNYNIISIDTCLLSKDDKDYGNLSLEFTERTSLNLKNDGHKRIIVMHHGVEWLRPESGRRFQHWLADNHIDMVFCGHNHAPGMNILTEAIDSEGISRDGIPQFTCGCALSDNYSNPVFMVVECNDSPAFEIRLYEYRNNSNWETAGGVLRSFPAGVYQESERELIKNNFDIPRKYDTIHDIGNDVAQELQESKQLRFFGICGKTFLRGNSTIANALYGNAKNVDCRLLISDPFNPNIDKRLRNVPAYAKQAQLEQEWKRIYSEIKMLQEEASHSTSYSIRFHDQPLFFRFIMTDQSVYFGYYEREESSQSTMYRYSKESSLYMSLKDYFDTIWGCSNTSFSEIVPDRCSFVLDKFTMKPSLVINLGSKCNMHCRYCPTGGENLTEVEEKDLCDTEQIEFLLSAYAKYYQENHWTEKKVVRITGGEPLIYQDRLIRVLEHARKEGYEKIVLCTNGVLLEDSYKKAPETWESVKNILLLKISLDSITKKVFNELTGSNKYDTVIKNIEFAKQKGFMIELNFVANKKNAKEIEKVYDYAYSKRLLGVKVLTINDFGERVKQEDVSKQLNALIEKMRAKRYVETGLYVHNNKGIHMKRFVHDNCTLTIVDHMNTEKSVTPRRTYSAACQSCRYYPASLNVQSGECKPCATGIMSLTMRADGLISFCRLQDNSEKNIAGCNFDDVTNMVKDELMKFRNCYHYQIGE